MKDPCLRCLIQPCCHEVCNPRILYSALIYVNNYNQQNELLYDMWERNKILLQGKKYIQQDYVEKLMNHYIKIVKRKNQRNEETTGTPTSGEIPDAV